MELLKHFATDESGQGLTEYASIVALVSVALILVLVAFRDELARIYNAMRNELNTQIGSINQAST
jgi:Flp pilus assembly pilin Flp